ncbi:MAG: M23 family metallopeptidase [candidate division KSB1 bacterium]|nr:M23 family metallopeptidase [candidate division KSB1 bacterium]MDZ7368679.1 M23 family metallopeptidase [candidate division KSB1 bacterium]MDZ7406494.1 M23 family metallopeptidase [candidate division KSB1 bacterium]
MKRNRFPVWQFLAGNAALFFLLFLFRWLTAEHDVFKLGWRPASVDADTTTLAAITPTIMFEPTIGYGETLVNLLQECAVHPSDIVRTISALQKIFDPRDLRAGHSIRVAIDSSGALQQLLYRPSPEIAVRVEREANGDLTSRCDTLALSAEAFLLTGEIETSVWQAVLDGGEKPDLLMDFTDIFQWDIDFFNDPQRGDRFRIFFEKLFVTAPNGEREFVRYGRILAASYEPKQAQEANAPEKFFIAFYFKTPNGRDGYFDGDGKSFQKTFLKSPLNYRRISSRFSMGRRHPILKQVRAHTGVDYAADHGTPVVASANGVVKEIGWKGGYGNCLVIEHKNHYATLYGHLSRFAESLKAGDTVTQNQIIGYVGSTGLSTGPHLHYTMYLNGKAINPLKIQPSSGDPIPAELMPRFIEQRDALLQQLGLAPAWVTQPAP